MLFNFSLIVEGATLFFIDRGGSYFFFVNRGGHYFIFH